MSIEVKSERTLTVRGQGTPDYQGEVFRSHTFKRFKVKGDEAFKLFQVSMSATPSPYPWMVVPLAVGGVQNLIDVETGAEMPYTVPVGYELEVLMIWLSVDQRVRMGFNLDTYLAGEYFNEAYAIYFESEIKEFTTADIDPLFSRAHLIQFFGVNIGAADMHGYAKVVAVLREHGSQRPKVKMVVCKGCKATHEVPVETTIYECPDCGFVNYYFYFPWGGDLR